MAVSPRRTKIVATIGPSSSSDEMLGRIIEAGMDGARLNFSHGRHEDHAANAQKVRDAQKEAGRPIALIADLQGPKLRIGELPEKISLAKDETIVVSGEDGAHPDDLPVLPAVLGSVLEPGDDVLVDDGLVRLRVERVEAGRAFCRVVTGGVVEAHKGVNVPGVPLPVPSLTSKDLADLELAVELGVDYVAQSFVRSRADVAALRAHLEEARSEAWVIAKIELKEAVDAF
jgi:pyruvate kinase